MNRLTVTQLANHLADNASPKSNTLTLVDVRELWEYELCHLPGSVLVPLATIPRFIEDADPSLSYVFICHHGIRSARATAFASANGFENVSNLTGGVAAWAAEIDPDFPVY